MKLIKLIAQAFRDFFEGMRDGTREYFDKGKRR